MIDIHTKIMTKSVTRNDKTEIICSGGRGFSGGNFWYILEYNENTTEYEFEWVSSYYGANYGETSISTITYFLFC